MNILSKILVTVFIVGDILLCLWIVLHNTSFPQLNPQGYIAVYEKEIILFSLGLMLAVGIPVVILAFVVAHRYNEKQKRTYTPDWTARPWLMIAWWGSISAVIAVLSVVGWIGAHMLDPYAQIPSNQKPLTVEVVALQWKWLFIYPQQGIATVNLLEIPQNVPVDFELTADNAPMNSFWIPNLGGQMYSMIGMVSHLHLIASKTGTFEGSAAELSGPGFAGMRFPVQSVSQNDFYTWVQSAQASQKILNTQTYSQLVKPSEYNPRVIYGTVEPDLYTHIVMKYMTPSSNNK